MKRKTEQRRIEYDIAYMKMARCMGELSYAVRNKVGAIIVSKNGQIISQGFNGTPSGADNCCEDVICNWQLGCRLDKCKDPGNALKNVEYCTGCDYVKLVTKKSVLHAESNAIAKCAKWLNTTEDATIYITLSPCYECSKLIIQSGIKRVVFETLYRDTTGIDNLISSNIIVERLDINNKTLTKY